MNEYVNPVGAGIPRLETREKLTGQAQFTDDLFPRGLLHGAILSSPYPHARILSYDVSKAAALPGVEAVVTGADLGENYMGPFIKDETALARGKVRYVGEPVAAVAAVDLETARKAVNLIEVEYEELPAVLTPEEAMAPGAPLVHENLGKYFKAHDLPMDGNQFTEAVIAEGDVDAAWSQCDVIVESEFETQAQYHAYMEPCSAVAEVDASGKVTVWSANQSVFRVQANVAESLGLPMSKVRAVTPRVGGAFGGKMESTIQPLTVLLALKARRPVKVTLSREQDFEMIRSRHPAKIWMKTGAKKDGTLLAREARIVLDAGAFADDSPGVAGICSLFGRGPYHVANVRIATKAVYTNKLRAGAFRGFGGPQVAWAGETQIDEIAAKLGIDPIDLRIKNAVRGGEDWMCGTQVKRSAMVECLEQVRAACDWSKRRKVTVGSDGRIRTIGVAALPHISGLLTSGAIVRLLEDGTAVLNTGAVDNGQGSDTVLVQMCAQTLGLRVDQISLATPDTDASPYNWGTTASRVTYMAGRAVVAAATSVVDQL
ncbi:MAG TPA: molybdopterin cofactor-binding domain-containing protein, partial [Alphaproteobacteria bacterium]